jgi:hypothetical protein
MTERQRRPFLLFLGMKNHLLCRLGREYNQGLQDALPIVLLFLKCEYFPVIFEAIYFTQTNKLSM